MLQSQPNIQMQAIFNLIYPVGSFEVLFTGAGSRKISTGLVPNIVGAYFSCYYPNVGGIRGYKVSDTRFHIDDVDGAKDWELFGIK